MDRILDKSNIREERGLLWFTVPGCSAVHYGGRSWGQEPQVAGNTASAGRQEAEGWVLLLRSHLYSVHAISPWDVPPISWMDLPTSAK